MKQLIIQSDTHQEDEQAAVFITQQMKHGDQDKIIWHSNLGRKLALIDEIIDNVKAQEGRVCNLERDICDLKYKINDLGKKIREIDRKAVKKAEPEKKDGEK